MPLAPSGDLKLLVQQVHSSLGHAGRDTVLKMARTQFHHHKLSRMVIQVVCDRTLFQQYKGRLITKFPFEKPDEQGILTNNRYTKREFKLKLSALLKAFDVKYTE